MQSDEHCKMIKRVCNEAFNKLIIERERIHQLNESALNLANKKSLESFYMGVMRGISLSREAISNITNDFIDACQEES